MSQLKISFSIKSIEGEYLAYHSRNEYGAFYCWTLDPDLALIYDVKEQAEAVIKWIDHPILLKPQLMEKVGNYWRPIYRPNPSKHQMV